MNLVSVEIDGNLCSQTKYQMRGKDFCDHCRKHTEGLLPTTSYLFTNKAFRRGAPQMNQAWTLVSKSFQDKMGHDNAEK